MNNIVKIGLIGVGNMGRNHLRVLSILKRVEIVFVYDPNVEALEKIKQQYQVNTISENLEDYLDKIDAAIIVSPTKYHYDYIALLAGKVKNIFVEKPVTATLDEANKVLALKEKHNFNLMTGFIERYNPAVQQMKAIMANYKTISIDFTRTNKLSSRITDVDVVSDLMIHDIDLARYLNGDVVAINAQGFLDGNMIAFCSATLTHANGAFSRLQASRITEKKDRSIKATCEDLYIDCDLLRKEIILNKQSVVNNNPDQSYSVQSVQESVGVKQEEALLLELQTFIALCLGEKSEAYPDLVAGYEAVSICEKIQKQVIGN